MRILFCKEYALHKIKAISHCFYLLFSLLMQNNTKPHSYNSGSGIVKKLYPFFCIQGIFPPEK